MKLTAEAYIRMRKTRIDGRPRSADPNDKGSAIGRAAAARVPRDQFWKIVKEMDTWLKQSSL